MSDKGPKGTKGPLLFLDVETQSALAELPPNWREQGLLRMAVATTFDPDSGRLRIYHERDAVRLARSLHRASRVVGYNINGFDIPAIESSANADLSKVSTFDMMLDIERKTRTSVPLDGLLLGNLGIDRTTDGFDVIHSWRNGEVEKVITRCCLDVICMWRLFSHGAEHGEILLPGASCKDWRRVKVFWQTDNLVRQRLPPAHHSP